MGLRKYLVVSTCLVALVCGGARADEQRQVNFNITAGDLAAALNQYGQQSEQQIVFATDATKGKRVRALSGSFESRAALDALLKGSGLTYRVDANSTILVMSASGAARRTTTPSSPSDATQLAQAQAQAQASPALVRDEPASSRIEEVIVTAQQRAERLQDVPMVITALSGETLRERGVDSYQDLSFAVPELRVHQVIPGQTNISLRGIGAAGGSMPLVGIYLDDVAASGAGSRSLDVRTLDLARIEVLHGPQGTLWGQGSAGGTIRFITNDPSFDGPAFTGSIDASLTQDGAPSQKVTGVANMPVIEDTLALRAAVAYENVGGWIDLPAANRKNINDGELLNARLKALLNIGDAVTLTAMAIVHRNDTDSPDGGESAAGNAYRPLFAPTLDQPTANDYEVYSLVATADLGGAELFSASAYYQNRTDSVYTTPLGANGRHFIERDRDEIFNQEVRLASTGEGPLNWTIGTFFRDSNYASDLTFVAQSATATPTVFNLFIPDKDVSKSWSYFANASYDVTDRLEIGGGLRYFKDKRKHPSATPIQTAKFDSVDPRVYVSYAITPDVKAYASAAKGFRSGGFNSSVAFRQQYEPDKVYSYEAGVKFSGLDQRLTGEFAGYYSEYKDMQLSTPVPGLALFYLGNVGKAKIKGVDWSLAVDVTDVVSIGTAGSLIDSDVAEIPAGSALAVGDDINYVANYNYSLFAQARFPWSADIDGVFRVDYAEKGKATFTARTSNLINQSEVINILYARLGAEWQNVSLDLYADNILNDRDRVAPNIVGFSSRPRPRTFGVKATANF